jgi:hypothetical protein
MSKRGVFNFPTSGTSFNEARVGVRGNDPDYLYYNAQIINNSTATTAKTNDPDLRYQDTRAVAILQDKSNYAVSVENFTINGAGKNLPVFIPQIREFNSDGSVNRNPNNTIYDITFTVQYGQQASPIFTYQSTRSVQWEPENKAVWTTQPAALGTYQYPQPEIPYYYCYTYSHWVSLVNKALALAWGDVISAAKNGGVPGLSIVINSLSGSKCTLSNVQGTFVVGARVRSVGTGVESIAEITSLENLPDVPFTINVISGNFTPGTEIEQSPDIDGQLPDIEQASAIIDTIVASTFNVGEEVECRDPATLAIVGTGIVVSFEGNTVVVYNVNPGGQFIPGYLLNQEPNVGTASITTTSIFEEFTVPEILLGTKCPFYTYDSKTNLFSLWQDSNTCVVPFGSAVPSPSPLSGFGASTASGYVPGEFSFIGYNTNFESLFTNFNSTYYSDQVPLATGASIQSPVGTESISQATVVNTDGAQIVSFPDGTNQMVVQWSGNPVSVAGSNWTFDSALVSPTQLTLVTGGSYDFEILNIVAGYVQNGFVFTVTASNDKTASGYVTAVVRSGDPLEITLITLQILSADPLCSGSGWKFTLPIDSLTFADPREGIEVSLITDVYPHETPLVAGYNVQVSGPQGQQFTGTISSFTETIDYSGATGTSTGFVSYENSTLPLGFSPVVSFQAQSDDFIVGSVVQGQTSKATGKIIEMTSGNQGVQNTLQIIKQSGPFAVGDTWSTSAASGTITAISGPNTSNTAIRTGIMTIDDTYLRPVPIANLLVGTSYTISVSGNSSWSLVGASSNAVGTVFVATEPGTGTGIATTTYYSGPFNIGDTIQDIGSADNSAVITDISGDNGYTTVTYSSQKNPFVIGHQIECYASFNNTAQTAKLCSGTVVDVIGENLGYGTVNVGNQNGQFGIGEVIVNNTDNSVATIVSIEGPNNGYGTVSYINQQTTGAPGAFIPGEFLLFADTLDAFGKVVLDTQNVLNLTEGNIGSVTVITGVETNNVFTPTSNIPLPVAGQLIIGSESGTVADFGGIVYLDSAVLTVNNVAGSFAVGDLIVDNVGFGLATSAATISVTATCNGFSYLGTGQLVLKNTQGGATEPATFGTSNYLVDYDTANPPTQTNAIAMNIVDIPINRQFNNGDPVSCTYIIGETVVKATGTVIANCGSFPYPSTDTTSQLLTILPDRGSQAFVENETLFDERPSATLAGVTGWSGPFITGDSISCEVGSVTLVSPPTVNAGSFVFGTQYQITTVGNTVWTAIGAPDNDIGTIFEATGPGSGSGVAVETGFVPGSGETILYLSASRTIVPGSVVTGQTTGTTAKVISGSGTQYVVNNVRGSFDTNTPGELIKWNASGNIFAAVPLNNPKPTEIFLTNVNGVFPAGGGLATNNSRELISFTGVSIGKGFGGGFVGTWAVPLSGDSVYNWNKSENMLCMGFITEITNIPDPGFNTYNSFFAVYQQLEQTFANGDCLGVLPFLGYDNDGTAAIFPSGLNITIDNNNAGFVVGSLIYFYVDAGGFSGYVNVAGGKVISIEKQTDNTYILNVAISNFAPTPGDAEGIRRTNRCGTSFTIGANFSTVTAINYYTNGYAISTVPTAPYRASATFSASASNSNTDGIIQSINISSSSAFVQTSKPPARTTALTLTNVDGVFTSGSTIVRDTTTNNLGKVQDFNDTTDYAGDATTLTVKDVVGSVVTGAFITDSNSKIATINSVTLANGGFIMQPLSGTLVVDEKLVDLDSQVTATYTGSSNQTLTGLTSDTTAIVLIDSGSQLKLGSISGVTGFQVGEPIQSSLGIVAEITGFPLFGVGNALVGPGGTGTIVSDSGTQVVIKNVQGQFSSGNVLTSTGVTATAELVSAPTLNIVPYNSTGESSLWTIIPAPLTSTTTAIPIDGEQSSFTTNLTIEQTIFNVDDNLSVTEVDPILTIEQLYYPENVVNVDLSAGNYSIETLQSLFPSGATGTQYVVLVQDFQSTSSLWSPVASIVIGTQFITVREEYSGTPITIGTGNLGSNASTGSFQKVLLETPIEVLPQESWRGLLYYEQKVEKMSSLGMSKEDLKNLDIQVYWRNRLTNSLTPLTLYNGGSANIRILFKRIHE